MQRVASFGSLAQRIRHEASNPLAVARLAVANLQGDLAGLLASPLSEEEGASPPSRDLAVKLARRTNIIDKSLGEVSGKLLELLKFSQRIGFVRTTTDWNDVVREVLIWLSAERQRRAVEVHVFYGDLPQVFVEPNELFGVLVTIVRLVMEALEPSGGLLAVRTSASADGAHVRTEIQAPDAPLGSRIPSILEPAAGTPEELSPLHFEWALARQTVETEYQGSLTWLVREGAVSFLLELPLNAD
jgi:signal transduction histidine kinase